LRSGITVTWAHHNIIKINNKKTNTAIYFTILLGAYFTALQAWEYLESSFSIRDSIFGSVFFVATGFHGIHVLVGTLFLSFSLIRHNINILSFQHHSGIEIAIWYWHFVDVVWLFLFSFIYWWAY
jgi:cytochrome c oxidase subunit 3